MNRAYDDSMRAQKKEAKAKQRACMAAKQRGDDTPSSSSSGEEESSESDVLRLQSGAAIGDSRSKRARTGAAPGSGSPSTHRLVPVRFIRAKRCLSCFGLPKGTVTYFLRIVLGIVGRHGARRPAGGVAKSQSGG